jgi:DNA-binding response OmpR family regulator
MKEAFVHRRVLIVDDRIDAAEMMQMLLDIEGYDTRIASSGEEGLTIASSFAPHIICTDIGMPGMSGLDFGRKIRQTISSHKVLLVGVTGWSDADTKAETLAAGFDFHFGKPVAFEEISQCFRSHFQEHPPIS